MVHDVSGPGVIKVFEEWAKKGVHLERVWNPDKVWVSEDHFVPAADKISANNIMKLTNWTKKFGIKKHYKYGLGSMAYVIHCLMKKASYYRVKFTLEAIRTPTLLAGLVHLP